MNPNDTSNYPDFFRKIVQIIPNPVFIKNDQHKFILVNDAYCTFFGIDSTKILGKKDDLFFPLEECEVFWAIDRRVLTKGISIENEETITLQNGKMITAITRKSLLESNGEKFILGIITDISEKTQMMEKIKESEIKFKNLIDSLPNLLLIHKKGRVQFANKAILETLGNKSEIVHGMNVSELFIDPLAKNTNGSLLKKFLKTDKGTFEIQIKSSDVPIGVKTFLLLNRNVTYEGTPSILSILMDITDRKNIEKYILGKVIETEEKERRRFAADVHDDIGPLISTARLHVGFLEKTTGSPQFIENCEKIYNILDEMDSKIHFIIQNVVPHELNLNGLETTVRHLCKTIEENRTIVIELTSNLNNFRFPKDIELHFYRIISELLNNSMKHSGATRIYLKLNRTKKMFRVWYSDNGKGYDIHNIPDKDSGIGINNIMYRADLINGDLNFEKKAGKVIVKISKRL